MWQPIGTAPKDGQAILTYWPSYPDEYSYGCSGVTIAYWKTNPRTQRSYFSHTTEMDDYDLEDHPPSHWQPLPAPPQTQEK